MSSLKIVHTINKIVSKREIAIIRCCCTINANWLAALFLFCPASAVTDQNPLVPELNLANAEVKYASYWCVVRKLRQLVLAMFSQERAVVVPKFKKIPRQCLIYLAMAAYIVVPPSDVNAANLKSDSPNRVNINFNTGWLFSGSVSGDGAAINMKESSFKPVTLPHTIAVVPHMSIDTSVYSRITWYRKHFVRPDSYRGRRISIEFQAVSKYAEVFCNGQHVGGHKGAYTPFTVDITDHVSFGGDNIIAVQVDSRQRKDISPEGKDLDYMVGGGIVRDVALVITNTVYVDWIYARRDTACTTCVQVNAKVVNSGITPSSGTVQFTLADASKPIAVSEGISYTLAPGAVQNIHVTIGPVKNLKLWHPDNPFLYMLHAQLMSGTKCIDDYQKRIGIRSVTFGKERRCMSYQWTSQ